MLAWFNSSEMIYVLSQYHSSQQVSRARGIFGEDRSFDRDFCPETGVEAQDIKVVRTLWKIRTRQPFPTNAGKAVAFVPKPIE